MSYRQRWVPRALARDALWLGVAQLVQYAVPLAVIPYGAHVLGARGWGEVAAMLAAGNLLALLPAYGFQWTATRSLAMAPTAEAQRAIVTGTALARVGLTGVAVGIGTLLAVIAGGAYPLAWAGVVYVAAQGVSWGWAFEGQGRFRTAALLYALARAPVPLLVLLTVHHPGDASRVLLAYACASALETGAGFWLLRNSGHLSAPGRVAAAWAALRDGGWLFGAQLAVLTYVGGNPLWVRLLATSEAAGVYGASEAVARAATGLVLPLHRALLPRMSRAHDQVAAGARLGGVVGVGLGLAAGAVLLLGAPLLPKLLGGGFSSAVPVLRTLALLPVLVALSQAAGVNVALARRQDARVALLFGAGAAVNLIGAFVLVPRWGAVGMARALLLAEASVVLLSLLFLRRPAPVPAV